MIKKEKKNSKSKDGFNLCYETWGERNDNPVLFFLHGLGGDLDAWQFVREKFRDGKYFSIAMDIRGHGNSDHPGDFTSYRLENLADDVVSIMDQERIDKVVLIGHCYGGVVALRFALKYPEKSEGLVVVSSTYRPPNYIIGETMKKIANCIINLGAFVSPKPWRAYHSKYPVGKFHRDYELVGLIKTIFYNSLRSYLLTSREIINLDLAPFLGKIKTPTLVVVGEKDSIFPADISRKIHESITGSRFAVIKSANHVVILNNTDEVFRLTDNFLSAA